MPHSPLSLPAETDVEFLVLILASSLGFRTLDLWHEQLAGPPVGVRGGEGMEREGEGRGISRVEG